MEECFVESKKNATCMRSVCAFSLMVINIEPLHLGTGNKVLKGHD
jgi:hypothetical protein